MVQLPPNNPVGKRREQQGEPMVSLFPENVRQYYQNVITTQEPVETGQVLITST